MIRLSPLVVSAALHVAVVGIVGGHGAVTAPGTSDSTEMTIDIETLPVEAPVQESSADPEPTRAAARAPSHRHDYPVQPDHSNRPHDPSLVHAPVAAQVPAVAAPPVAEAPASAPPRFVLPSGSRVAVAHSGSQKSGASAGTAAGNASSVGAIAPGQTFSESNVSVRARLQRAAPVAYPPDARDADLEADVPVEIVVDASGAVVEARAVGQKGNGFDEAAVRAVRGYRFSPARREGQSVRVRMRWVVHFRLR